VHEFCRAHYRINRTGGDAFNATNTVLLNYKSDAGWFVESKFIIQRFDRNSQQIGQIADALFTARRALVNIGNTRRNSLGVGATTRETALATLGLR
jgi:hypothetical protein